MVGFYEVQDSVGQSIVDRIDELSKDMRSMSDKDPKHNQCRAIYEDLLTTMYSLYLCDVFTWSFYEQIHQIWIDRRPY